jgi:hypothetical protein
VCVGVYTFHSKAFSRRIALGSNPVDAIGGHQRERARPSQLHRRGPTAEVELARRKHRAGSRDTPTVGAAKLEVNSAAVKVNVLEKVVVDHNASRRASSGAIFSSVVSDSESGWHDAVDVG